MSAIPLKLVTGFLGSGKTTFLLNYLNVFADGRKIGVIQNEFSSGIDGTIIRKNEGVYSMLEVNNGSVFCVCLLGTFIDSLVAFIDDNHPDEIIMEASGLSDPISIGQIFHSGKLWNKVYLEQSWTIVDAVNFNRLTFVRPIIDHQIRIADIVLVNKSDLTETDIVIKEVERINPYALVVRSSFSKIDFRKARLSSRSLPDGFSADVHKPDLQSAVIKSSSIIRPEMLRQFIDSVKYDFVRIKGFVNTGKTQKVLVQGTFTDYKMEPFEWFPGVTELVGIGKLDDPDKYTKKFESYCRLI